MKAKLKLSWDFNRTKIEKDTEVTIIKGMEADAADVLNVPYGMCYLCEFEGSNHYIPATYLTITDCSNIDWEQVRIQAAIATMQKFAGRHYLSRDSYHEYSADDAAKMSVKYADALITELKKKNKV